MGGLGVTVDDDSSVSAGWYPDPADAASLRRWDGENWTADVSPAQSGAPTASAPVKLAPAPALPDPQSDHASGSVPVPDWANLPGLTLPPDLSAFAGSSDDSVLKQPQFDDPAMFEDPLGSTVASPVLAPPIFEEPTAEAEALPPADADTDTDAGAPADAKADADADADADPVAVADADADADVYAPPPSGSQYSAPPPAGVAYTPPAPGVALDPLALPLPPAADTPVGQPGSPGSGTLGVWMLAALPLLQFAVVYVVYGVLGQPLVAGIQWGILVVPALFSLVFAAADRKKLLQAGHDKAPNSVLGILAPVYLIARVAVIGPKSIAPLVLWIVLQAAAVVGVLVLLPTVLTAAISGS
jgi:Protein of unknown function (DUF2510)